MPPKRSPRGRTGGARSGRVKKERLCRCRVFPEKIKSWQRPTLPQSSAVPSALESLTSVFGMGTGVASPPLSPGNMITYLVLLRLTCLPSFDLRMAETAIASRRYLGECRWIEAVRLSIDAPGNMITCLVFVSVPWPMTSGSECDNPAFRSSPCSGGTLVFSQNCTGIKQILFSLRSSPRSISTGQLNASLHLHIRPINHLVLVGPYFLDGMGELILRSASRLDAFSAYHVQT